MGAAASVRMVYKDALGWFKQYIDTEVGRILDLLSAGLKGFLCGIDPKADPFFL
jgi:hypothetical protein